MASHGPASAGAGLSGASWLRRHHKEIIAALAAAGAGYAAYRAYQSNTLSNTQQALRALADTLANGGASLALVASDLHAFLSTDSDEVPQSLRQVAKLARSADVQAAMHACVASAVAGATQQAPSVDGAPPEPSLVDKVIEAALSERGHSLVGLAISMAARESTAAMGEQVRAALAEHLAARSNQQQPAAGDASLRAPPSTAAAPVAAAAAAGGDAWSLGVSDAASRTLSGLLGVLASERGERLLRLLISSSVSSAVRAYLEGAASLDTYSPLLAAVAQPAHTRALSQLMSSAAGSATHELITSYFAAVAAYQQQAQQQQQQQYPYGGPAAQQGAGEPQLQLRALRQASASSSPGGPRVEEVPASAGSSSSARGPAGGPGGKHAAGDSSGASEPESPTSSDTGHSGPQTPEPSLLGQPSAATAGTGWAGMLRRRRGPGAGGPQQQQPRVDSPASTGDLADLGGGGAQQQLVWAGVGLAGGFPAAPGWSDMVALVGQAARNDGIRRLMVEVSASSTREFVRALVEPLAGGGATAAGGGGSGEGWAVSRGSLPGLQALVARLYVVMSVAALLLAYLVSPQLALQGGGA